MSDGILFSLTLIAALGCGLIAGVFLAFSSFVMKALARLAPSEGIAAMQSINLVVLKSWFMAVFLGSAVVCVVLAISVFMGWQRPKAAYLLAGSALYLVGAVLVTGAFNVPRNDALALVDRNGLRGESLWQEYLVGWTAWNHVRTAAALAAAACFTLALAG